MSKSLRAFMVVSLMLASVGYAQDTSAPTKSQTKSSAKPAPQDTQQQGTKAQPKVATRADRLDLDTTVVTGNRELPKVLYIVPWKKAELGELPAQPFNTLLDEVLQPVDREVFKREVKYFQAVSAGVGSAAAANPGSTSPVTQAPTGQK